MVAGHDMAWRAFLSLFGRSSCLLETLHDGVCGCPQDDEKAAYYFHMAAEDGVPAGMSWTGHLLMTGFGAGALLHWRSQCQLNLSLGSL